MGVEVGGEGREGRGGGRGTASENRKHGKEREMCSLVPGSFLLLSPAPYTAVCLSCRSFFSPFPLKLVS